MKDRPILFQGAMVRALLNGSKTQTRRVVKTAMNLEQRESTGFSYTDKKGMRWMCGVGSSSAETMRNFTRQHSPYGQPGDRLWVRETWAYHLQALSASNHELSGPWVYCADGHTQHRLCDRWRPSIHMPRAASRITLEITGVRVERLQNISEADAIAEGIERGQQNLGWYRGFLEGDSPNIKQLGRDHKLLTASPKLAYQSLWTAINGPESWAANPWVWVVEFKRVEGATA